MINLIEKIREIPDFPVEGINFKDVTTLLQDPSALSQSIQQLMVPYKGQSIDQVVGIESRGFIFGVPMALQLNAGFVPIRKPGKLPYQTIEVEYQLEYGSDKIAIHTDAIQKGEKVILVDDLLATGGTMSAAIQAVEKLGAEIVGISFLIELSFLNGREKLKTYPVYSVISY